MQCVMDHIVFNVSDVNRMIEFYTRVLQLEPERLREYQDGKIPFPSLRLNADTVIDLFPESMWQGKAPAGPGRENLNHLCIALLKEEWDALQERLALNSVEIADGPVPRWGAHGTGTSIYFRDPEGNLVEARYYEAGPGPAECLLGS